MLTKEEKQTLLRIFDVAVKAGGLSIAQNVLFFIDKLGLTREEKEEEVNKKLDKKT